MLLRSRLDIVRDDLVSSGFDFASRRHIVGIEKGVAVDTAATPVVAMLASRRRLVVSADAVRLDLIDPAILRRGIEPPACRLIRRVPRGLDRGQPVVFGLLDRDDRKRAGTLAGFDEKLRPLVSEND